MLTKEVLLKRVQDLSKSVNESLDNYNRSKIMIDNMAHQHNALSGRLDEVTSLYNEILRQEAEKGREKTEKIKS
jgi:hypothetical protein